MTHAGYSVATASAGREALNKVKEQAFDVVLLDLMLPDIDGLALIPTLRAIDPTLPVIIITAFLELTTKHGSLSEGAFGYLTNPYDREELKALVRRAVSVKQLSLEAASTKQALTTSERRLRQVLQTAPDAVILADEAGHIVSWNAAAERLFGYAAGEVLGQPLTIIIPERYRRNHEQGLRRVRKTGEVRHQVVALKGHGLRKDGREFPIEVSLSSWMADGTRFFCGMVRDVTARDAAEAALIRQQIEQQALLDLIPAMVWYKDTHNRILRANRRAAASLNKTVAEIEGQSTYDLYPDEAEKYYQDDLEVISSGRPKLGIVEPYQMGTGEKRWVQTDKVPYHDTDGTVLGVLVFAQDITERAGTEQALRESEERLRAVVESSPNGIVMIDAAGTIVLVNAALAMLFGYEEHELLGQSVDRLVPERFRDRHAEHRRAFLEHPTRRRMGQNQDLKGLRKDGTEFPIEISLAPLLSAEHIHVAASVVHISPRP